MTVRIGQGIDVHAFMPGDHLMLGGVRIPYHLGIKAHSDGDVALHALCDALLGALALGDIGRHFPPGDGAWRGADSLDLLRRVYAMIRAQGWVTGNVDVTIVCEEPKIAPHAEHMRRAIAAVLEIGIDAVSIKATTTERLGFCGRGEGIAAMAVALIHPA